ncbi:heavy metal sensor histidine kinase [Vibrio spartinae]|uniref:Sensor protein n=1 Tax=Vibrio spartinae TaxID=1918945 RepID=A0A1N6M9P5_9VIBR|nr:heavy metal sensor histidine kinase [Vibrio spartinae]SIO96154.1 Sensor kinase CusS [Vibrio spartinae]
MKLKLKNSMATKLIVMYMASSFVVLTSFALIVQYSIKHHFYQQDYQRLNNNYHTIFSAFDSLGNNDITALKAESAYLWVLDRDGIPLFTNTTLSLPEDSKKLNSMEWTVDGHTYRAFRFQLKHPQYGAIVLGLNIDLHLLFISKFNIVLLWTFVITSVISGVYAVFIVHKGLKPLHVLQKYLSKVSPNRLDIRVPVEALPVELVQLVETQNEMLERLQHGFNRLSEFSSDIAHELRTPLTNIMTQTHVTLSSKRTVEEYEEILLSNVEELERLNKTIQDTLYLAKSENHLLHTNKEMLQLAEVIRPLLEFYEFMADEKEVCVELRGDGEQFGDKQMLQRAVGNIISNALRHCDVGSVVSIQIAEGEEYNSIKIKNTGETIPESSLPYLFDRFYRADKSRKHSRSIGAGLGLAITRAIVQAHGGEITVSSSERVTEFALTMKKGEV